MVLSKAITMGEMKITMVQVLNMHGDGSKSPKRYTCVGFFFTGQDVVEVLNVDFLSNYDYLLPLYEIYVSKNYMRSKA